MKTTQLWLRGIATALIALTAFNTMIFRQYEQAAIFLLFAMVGVFYIMGDLKDYRASRRLQKYFQEMTRRLLAGGYRSDPAKMAGRYINLYQWMIIRYSINYNIERKMLIRDELQFLIAAKLVGVEALSKDTARLSMRVSNKILDIYRLI